MNLTVLEVPEDTLPGWNEVKVKITDQNYEVYYCHDYHIQLPSSLLIQYPTAWDSSYHIFIYPWISTHLYRFPTGVSLLLFLWELYDNGYTILADAKTVAKLQEFFRITKRILDELDRLDLYPHQKEAIEKLLKSGGRMIIVHDPGLGKTRIATLFFKLISVKNFLVVAPKILLSQWEKEIKKLYPEANPTFINYERLDKVEPVFEGVIFDEAHYIKNFDTQRTQSALRFSSVPYVLLLTASPCSGKPEDVLPMLRLVSSRAEFFWNKSSEYYSPYGIRVYSDIKDKSILSLPDKIRVPVFTQNKLAEAISLANFAYQKTKRVIVFAAEKEPLRKLNEVLYPSYLITGDVPVKEREKIIEKFNSEGGIILCTLRAASFGLNLQSANVVIFYSLDWNPEVIRQAEDRIHRIGQEKDCMYFYLFSSDDLKERKMLEVLKEKYNIISELLGKQSDIINPYALFSDSYNNFKEI